MTLQDLLDRKEIEDLSATYMRGLDRLDRRTLRSVFHDDAVTDYGFFKGGPDDFVEMAFAALGDHAANHHMLGQILVSLEGPAEGAADSGEPREAFGEVYFQAYHRISGQDGPQDLFIAGRYVDRYRKQDGVWKIAARAEINDWARTEPAADDFFRQQPAALRGARAPEDASCR